MKRTEKYIYLVLGIILIVVIACSITYIVATNNNKTETKEEPNNNQEENNNQDNDEQITLSESELEEYLSYVPYNFQTGETYDLFSLNVNNIPIKSLLGITLFNLSNEINDSEIIASHDKVSAEVLKRYNKKLATPINSYDEFGNWLNYAASYSGLCYTYEDGSYILNYCASGIEFVQIIDSYIATNNELIIYSYTILYNGLYGQNEIEDITGEYKVSINLPDDGYQNEENITAYVNINKSDFTKLKHTFKKNDTGYYWYSTEVASEE